MSPNIEISPDVNPTTIVHQQLRRLPSTHGRIIWHSIYQSDKPIFSFLSQRHWNILATTDLITWQGVPRRVSLEPPGSRCVLATAMSAIDGTKEDEVEDWAEAWETCLTWSLAVVWIAVLRTDLPQVMAMWLSTTVQICVLTKFHVISGDFRFRFMM